MPYDPNEHHRRSIRLDGHDYAHAGAYFVTICSLKKECLFGSVLGDTAELCDWGRIVDECWRGIPAHYPRVRLDEYIVMPNHIHGILWIGDEAAQPSVSLGTVLGSFKSAVTRRINQSTGNSGAFVWQRNYYEHIIRSDESLTQIRRYIQTNPQRWSQDAENIEGDRSDAVDQWVSGLMGAGHAPKHPNVGAGHAPPRPTGSESNAGRGVPRPYGQTDAGRGVPRPYGQTDAGRGMPRPYGQTMRVGHGYDLHRLQAGGRLVLGGVVVASDISPVAHSDGDVVLHAVVDALLGAVGKGDIGELFPNSDPTWKDAESRVFVEAAMELVRKEGYAVANADITILAERPKLKPFKELIRRSVEGMLDAPVNIKAGTNEGCDAIGRGEAIAAHAVVLLVRG